MFGHTIQHMCPINVNWRGIHKGGLLCRGGRGSNPLGILDEIHRLLMALDGYLALGLQENMHCDGWVMYTKSGPCMGVNTVGEEHLQMWHVLNAPKSVLEFGLKRLNCRKWARPICQKVNFLEYLCHGTLGELLDLMQLPSWLARTFTVSRGVGTCIADM